MSDDELSHLDERGRARMVDVGGKRITERTAVARGQVRMAAATMEALQAGKTPKGDVLAVARVAGIQAAKRTPELIPLCHGIQLTGCEVAFATTSETTLEIEASVRARDRTGAEMEALTATAVAALAIYDMLKAIDREMVVEHIALVSKTGGKSDFVRT